jgi:hypothetical protein
LVKGSVSRPLAARHYPPMKTLRVSKAIMRTIIEPGAQ